MNLVLGIDGGASSSRWRLEGPGGVLVVQGRGAPITGHVFTSEARAQTSAAIEALAADVSVHGRPSLVVAGITGLSKDGEPAALLRLALAELFAIDAERVIVLDDVRLAYLGAFAPGEGILVYAGTGSIAYHLAADQRVERAGGHGFLIDDAGGGFWIGGQALRAMLRRRDDGRPTTPLDRALFEAIGGEDWDTIRRFVYTGGRMTVATLAQTVIAAAAAGDSEAVALLSISGAELGRLVGALRKRLGALPVALAGGVGRASPVLFEALRREIGAGAAVRLHAAEPVVTAAALARVALAET